jgi:hypothetical protein
MGFFYTVKLQSLQSVTEFLYTIYIMFVLTMLNKPGEGCDRPARKKHLSSEVKTGRDRPLTEKPILSDQILI